MKGLTIKNFTAIGNGGSGLRINGADSLTVSCPKCGSRDVTIDDLTIVNNAPPRGKITCQKCGHSETSKDASP